MNSKYIEICPVCKTSVPKKSINLTFCFLLAIVYLFLIGYIGFLHGRINLWQQDYKRLRKSKVEWSVLCQKLKKIHDYEMVSKLLEKDGYFCNEGGKNGQREKTREESSK